MKKIISLLFLILIIPQIALAAWWNPFSWKIFSWLPRAKKTPTIQVEQNIATSTPESNKTNTKLEIEKLNNQQIESKSSSKNNEKSNQKVQPNISTPAKTETLISQPESENSWKYLVEGYASDAEWFKINIESIRNSGELSYIKNRRNIITALLSDIRRISPLSFSEAATFNEALDIYGDIVEEEVSHINQRLGEIDANLSSMDRYRAENQRQVDLLLADPNKFRPKEDYIAYVQGGLARIDKKYEGIENINNILIACLKEVQDKIDLVQQVIPILDREIIKLRAITTVKVPSPQAIISNPAPLIPYQPPKTTNCTISGDGVGLQAYINCTTY